MKPLAALLPLLLLASVANAETLTWSFTNPAGEYTDELLRIPVTPKAPFDSTKLLIKENGKEIPYQVEILEGTPAATTKAHLWVLTTVTKGATHSYEVTTNAAPQSFPARVSAKSDASTLTLSNSLLSLQLPAKADPSSLPAPILNITPANQPARALATWNLNTSPAFKLEKFTATHTPGPLFTQARLRYDFDAPQRRVANPYFYEITITLKLNQPLAHIEESFNLPPNTFWSLDLTKNFPAQNCLLQLNNDGAGPGGNSPGNSLPKDQWPTTLKAGQTRINHAGTPGDTHLYLLPRWSQAFDDGWFFAAHDNTNFIAAIPARAGKWVWPHENKIAVRVKPSGDSAILELPAHRGSRYWLLAAGPLSLIDSSQKQQALVQKTTMQHLDKIINEYISTWPVPDGQKPKTGSFQGAFFFDTSTNPTGARRQMGRNAVKDASKTGDLSTLFWAQVNLDPDFYGSYYNFWSPQNPNFFSDFHKTSIALVAQLRDHPRFPELRAKAEAVLREDMDHSITLPGGAGQECPGYLSHAVTAYADLAPLCKQYLNFDPTSWPRYKAAIDFQKLIAFPDGGGGRKQNPAGDTHPGKRGPDGSGTKPIDMTGIDISKRSTEEIPGFGVVFRNNPGTPRETFLSFKAGPNRGHYHGDQLAFHLCFNAKPTAVDHHCSYAPRAGQEHMHNRLAFSIANKKDFEYTNMDGYERLIAFKTSKEADIAIAQVESPRLRAVAPLPPEIWDDRHRVHNLTSPLIYRRTIVLIKSQDASTPDFFVLRDQYFSDEPNLVAHFMLHPRGDKTDLNVSTITSTNLTTLVAHPQKFSFEKFSWEHSNGGPEKTTGPRLSTPPAKSGQFITVLYPGEKAPKFEPLENGVRVGSDEIIFDNVVGNATANVLRVPTRLPGNEVEVKRDGKAITQLSELDFNFNRSQGDIGLFVPDAGYPFGPIPDWLIQQRTKSPKPSTP